MMKKPELLLYTFSQNFRKSVRLSNLVKIWYSLLMAQFYLFTLTFDLATNQPTHRPKTQNLIKKKYWWNCQLLKIKSHYLGINGFLLDCFLYLLADSFDSESLKRTYNTVVLSPNQPLTTYRITFLHRKISQPRH